MFRLGRLQAPRKVHADSCLHSQPFNENFSERLGDPARVAKKVPVRVAKKVLARVARREANLTRHSLPSQHTRKSLKTIRDGTRHSTLKTHLFAAATIHLPAPWSQQGRMFVGRSFSSDNKRRAKNLTARGEPSASFGLSCDSSRALRRGRLAGFHIAVFTGPRPFFGDPNEVATACGRTHRVVVFVAAEAATYKDFVAEVSLPTRRSSLAVFRLNPPMKDLSPTRHAATSNFRRKRMKTITVATHYSTLQKAKKKADPLPPIARVATGLGMTTRKAVARGEWWSEMQKQIPRREEESSFDFAMLRSGLRSSSDRRPG